MSDKWKILIVDDEEEIHDTLKLFLHQITFQNRTISVLDAYSAKKAQTILEENYDIALIILDVSMEHTRAGLDLTKVIRNDLKNNNVRIILRTGKAEFAPEKQIIEEYEIDSYTIKHEPMERLESIIKTSLRSYSLISNIDYLNHGLARIELLEKIVLSEKIISKQNTSIIPFYSSKIMQELKTILCYHKPKQRGCSGFYGMLSPSYKKIDKEFVDPNIIKPSFHFFISMNEKAKFADEKIMENFHNTYFNIFSALGKYNTINHEFIIPENVLIMMENALTTKQHIYEEKNAILYFENQETNILSEKNAFFIYLENFPEFNRSLAESFMEKIYGIYFKLWHLT